MTSQQSRKEITILTIEPGEIAISTRKLLIESVGFNCISALSGRQGLRFFDKHVIDAVLFELDMSDMPPAELLQQLRSKSRDVPVFAVARNGWVPQELGREIDGVFEKMSDPKHVVDELIRVFDSRLQKAS